MWQKGNIINSRWEKLFLADNKATYLEIRKLIQTLNLQINFEIINVVGTNGKGSVSSFLAQGLEQNGYKVGLFTSPHLIVPNERIRVNGKAISDTTFFQLKEGLPEFGYFETLYLVAIIYFAQMKVDFAIIEAGIGGNDDTTRALQGRVCVVTSIGLDHQDMLGATLKQIAYNKAGIVSSKMRLYLPSTLAKDLQAIFTRRTKQHFVVTNNASNFVVQNKLLALHVLKHEFGLEKPSFIKPFGRVDMVKIGDQQFIFDVGHNYDAIKATLSYLKDQQITLDNVVIAIMKKKNVTEIPALFTGLNFFYFKLNDDFHDFANVPRIDETRIKKLAGTTLLVGSFRFIGYLYQQWNLKKTQL